MTFNQLKASHHQLKASYEKQSEEITDLQSEVLLLKQQNAELLRMIFGQKSERFIPQENDLQLRLDLGDQPVEAEVTSEQISYQRKKVEIKHTPHGRQSLPAHLERRDIIIGPDEDTSAMKKIGEEITEELEYEPGQLYVNRIVRPKYVHPEREEKPIIIAELPSRIIEKGIAGPGLLAHMLISKFVDHLPIYRQLQMLKRQDVKLSKSTADGWIGAVCESLEPVYAAHKEQILDADYLMVDETPLRVQDKRKKGATHQGYFWVYYDPLRKRVFFDYNESRAGAAPEAILQDFKGALQSDGYVGYNTLNGRNDITELACMAHARRYFEKALKQNEAKAEEMLLMVQALYKIEARAREENLTAEQKYALRRKESAPVLEQIKAWLDENVKQALPASLLGKAIAYMLKRWDALNRYLEDGRYEIDNNLVENAIRPVALGRKNWLFAGSHKGAQRAAMIYSLVATAKLQGIEPWAYMKDMLTKLPDWPHKHIEKLLPINPPLTV